MDRWVKDILDKYQLCIFEGMICYLKGFSSFDNDGFTLDWPPLWDLIGQDKYDEFCRRVGEVRYHCING